MQKYLQDNLVADYDYCIYCNYSYNCNKLFILVFIIKYYYCIYCNHCYNCIKLYFTFCNKKNICKNVYV